MEQQIWEILDSEVHRSLVLVESLGVKINAAVEERGPDALRITTTKGGVAELYAIYRQERTHLARTAKQSMDAGTAKLRVMQARTNAEAIARVLTYALEAAGLDVEQRSAAMEAMAVALSIEAMPVNGSPRAIEGTTTPSTGTP
jgi:hypothetical protein